MEGVFLLVVFFFYILIRLVFTFRPDQLTRDRRHMAEGVRQLQMRDWAHALAYFDNALIGSPRSPIGLAGRARCHLELDEPLLAIADAGRAIQAEAHLPDAYLTRGRAFYQLEDYAQALLELEKACWYGRGQPEPLYWRGLAYDKQGQAFKAWTDMKAARTLGDENAAYYLAQRNGLGILE